jgi:hypothetical protein
VGVGSAVWSTDRRCGAHGGNCLIGYWLQPRVKLRYGVSHGYAHRVLVPAPQPPNRRRQARPQQQVVSINTASHLIMNDGRATATQVEVTFNYTPTSFEVWPQRQYTLATNPNGRFIVRFDSLSPKERFSANLLMTEADTPNLLSVRCFEAMGQEINFARAASSRRRFRWQSLPSCSSARRA